MIPKPIERPESTDRAVFNEVWEENVYHLTSRDFIHAGVAVDIGANVGAFALFAAFLGARRVIAYEPEQENFEYLLKNLEAHPALRAAIEPIRAAVWSHERELSMVSKHGGAQVSEDMAHEPRVSARTLDDVFRLHDIAECDVLKLDVEGAEYAIFGAASIETQNRCRRIVLEFHPAPDEVFGRLVARLTRTHKFFVLGSVDRGGYIWAERY
jgi:FkbM family methyltransferase